MKKCHSIAALMALVLLTSCMPNSEDGLKKKKESLENIKTDIDAPEIGSKPNPSIGNTPVAVDTPAAAGTPSTGNVSMPNVGVATPPSSGSTSSNSSTPSTGNVNMPNVGVATPPSSGSTSSNSSQIASMPQLKSQSFVTVQSDTSIILKLVTDQKGTCEYKIVPSGTTTDLLSGYSSFSSTGTTIHSSTLSKNQYVKNKTYLVYVKCKLQEIAYAPFVSAFAHTAQDSAASSEVKKLSLSSESLVIQQYGKSIEMDLVTPEIATCFYSVGIKDASVPDTHYMFSRTDKGVGVGYLTTSHHANYHELKPYTHYTVYVNCRTGGPDKDYPTFTLTKPSLTKHFFSGQTEKSTGSVVAVTAPSSTTPAVVTAPSSTAPAVVTAPSSTTPAVVTAPSSTTPAVVTAPSSTTPAVGTAPSSTTPAVVTAPSSTTPAVVTAPSSNTSSSVITKPIIEAKDVISNYLTVSNRKVYSAAEIASAQQALVPSVTKKDAQGNYKYIIDITSNLGGENATNEAIIAWSKFFVGSTLFAAYEGTNKKNISCRYSRKNVSYEDMYHARIEGEGIQFFPSHLKVVFSDEEVQKTGSLYYVKCKNFADDKIESLVVDMVVKFPSKAKALNLNFNATPDPLYTEAKSVNLKNLRFEKEAPAYSVSAANKQYFFSANTQKVEFSLETLENASCLYSLEDKSRQGTYTLFAGALEDKSWIPMIQKNGNKKIHYFNFDKKLATTDKTTLEVPVYVVCAREGQIMATTYTHHIKINF